MTEHSPVWTNEQIGREAANSGSPLCGHLLTRMRDAWQADRDKLAQRIAELEKWRTEAHRLRDAIMQMGTGNLQQAESEADDE